MIRLYIAGTPRPQPRARFVNGRVIATAGKKAKTWKDRLVSTIRRAGFRRVEAACGVRLMFFFPTLKVERHGKPHTHRPDKDNLEKLALDAMVKGGLLADDSLVAEGLTRKLWAPAGGCEILVYDPVEGAPVEDDVGASEV